MILFVIFSFIVNPYLKIVVLYQQFINGNNFFSCFLDHYNIVTARILDIKCNAHYIDITYSLDIEPHDFVKSHYCNI